MSRNCCSKDNKTVFLPQFKRSTQSSLHDDHEPNLCEQSIMGQELPMNERGMGNSMEEYYVITLFLQQTHLAGLLLACVQLLLDAVSAFSYQ